jgi:ribonuclease Z
MPELIVLGTAASVPNAEHDTIGLALRGPGWAVAIDCGGSPLHKLARAGVDMDHLRAVVLTHRHADHLYGLPMLVQGLWLGGRQEPLPIYGPGQALAVACRILDAFNLAERDGMFRIEWRPVALREGEPVLKAEEIRISATPVLHGDNDTLALRFENIHTGRAIVYSSDTEPCPALVRLAQGAEYLIHEATGDYPSHSSPAEAAEVASEAGVSFLVLIHYPVRAMHSIGIDLERWRSKAAAFSGPVILAHEGDTYTL